MMNNQIHFDGMLPDHWWFGVVEDVNDPLKIGRVRVRCIGYHAENRQLVPTSHLPWALVLMPSTSASNGGVGQTMGLQQGSWVVGFFMDGKKGQMPLVLGSIHHQHRPNPPGYGSAPNPVTGFNSIPNPPQFRGQPSGSDDVDKAAKSPVTLPGPSGSVLQNIPPDGYNFSNAPKRDTGAIKEDSGWLTLKDASNWPSKYYTPQELLSKGNGDLRFHRGTLLALDLATEKFGKKLTINSGYRDPSHNQRVGGASKSQHMYGRAIDINISGYSNAERARLVAALTESGFVGFGAGQNILHADTRRVGAIWSYGGNRSTFQNYLYPGFQQAGIKTTQGMRSFSIVRGNLSSDTNPAPEGLPDVTSGVSAFDGWGNQLFSSSPIAFGGSGGPAPDFRGGNGPATIRFNNPGAQYPGVSATKFGSTGYTTIGGGHKIAIFPDAVSGAAAQFDLLDRNYTGMTVAQAMQKWSGGNNVGSYLSVIQRETGLTPNTVLTKDLLRDPNVGVGFAKAMSLHETGQAYPLTDAQWRQAQSMALGTPYTSTAQTFSTADIVGFNDPSQQNPDPNYAGDSSINKQARGLNQEDAKPAIWDEHLAKRQDGNFNSIPTTTGQAWAEAQTQYDATYPDNQVWSTAKHMISMDDTPSAEGIIISHMSGTGIEMHPDGSQTNKTLGDNYDINNKNSFFYVNGENYKSINGNDQTLAAGDKIEEIQGVKEDRHLNDEKLETAGNLLLAAGENIRVNGVNLYFDGNVLHIKGAAIQIRADGDLDIVTGGKLRIGSEGGIDIKSGAKFNVETQGDVNLKSGAALKAESSGASHYKAGGEMRVQGSSYDNASSVSQFNTIRWNAAPAPDPTGGSSSPSGPDGADSAEEATKADESDNPVTVIRGPSEVNLQKPARTGPTSTDFELDAFGPPNTYIHAINRSGSPSGPGVDTSEIQWMVGDDNYHEPECMFLGTFAKQALSNLVDDRSLHNVQGVMNFLKYTRRDGISIPELTPEQLTTMIKAAQRHQFPLDIIIGISSFKNWQGADAIAQTGRMAYKAIKQANGGRDPSRGELYMAYEHGIGNGIQLIKKALDKSTMNQYVVKEDEKRKKDAIPTDSIVIPKKKLFWVGGDKGFKRWRTYREHYDFMAHRLNHGFGRAIIPGLFKATQ